METMTDDKYCVVYNQLYAMYSKIAMQTFEYLTSELVAMISHSVYSEVIQMARQGLLNEYYERVKKGAV